MPKPKPAAKPKKPAVTESPADLIRSASALGTDKTSYKEFVKTITYLARQYSPRTLFDEFLRLAVYCYHPRNLLTGGLAPDPEVDQKYLEVVRRLDPETVRELPKLLANVQINAILDPYSDLLGTYFVEHITKGHNGQFFTPPHLAQLMAELTIPKDSERKLIADPACGAGIMLLQAAKHSPKNLFFGADIDVTCARMAVLNLFLNRMSGQIAHMDTLRLQVFTVWQVNVGSVGIEEIPVDKSVFGVRSMQEQLKTSLEMDLSVFSLMM